MKRIHNYFETFEKDLLDEIVERVASKPFKDLMDLRLGYDFNLSQLLTFMCNNLNIFFCRKLFNEIGSERWVYKKLSLDDVPLRLLVHRTSRKFKIYESFMKMCTECGNTEAMYRKRVVISLIKIFSDVFNSLNSF